MKDGSPLAQPVWKTAQKTTNVGIRASMTAQKNKGSLYTLSDNIVSSSSVK